MGTCSRNTKQLDVGSFTTSDTVTLAKFLKFSKIGQPVTSLFIWL